MKKYFIIFLLICLFLPYIVLAEYRPGYIITDNDLIDTNEMTIEDIQTFLRRKKSYLTNYTVKDEIKGKDIRASEIIYNAAKKYTVNPKVLLTMLQKEQSLIENSSPTQYALDWATGFGMCDSCTRHTPGIDKYIGFKNQVELSAQQIRKYLEAPHAYNFKKGGKYNIDGQEVLIANKATAVLYIYTPHLHGNLNFWRIWERWFSKKYANGSLLKTPDNPTVWLIHYGQRRAFKSMSVLLSKYDPSKIVIASPHDLEKYEVGNLIQFHEFSLLQDPNDKVYLYMNDKMRPIESQEVFRKLGFNSLEVLPISWEDLNLFEVGETITMASAYPTGALLQDPDSGGVYFVRDGKKYPLYAKDLLKTNFKRLSVLASSRQEIDTFETQDPVLFNDGELIKAKDSPAVYLVDEGTKRPFLSGEVFEKLGFKWDNVVETSGKLVKLHPTGEPIDNSLVTSYNKLSTN